MLNDTKMQIILADRIRKFSDIMAISASTLCFFHCLFTPVAMIFLPILGVNALDSEYFHKIMLFLVLPSTAVAVSLGCRRHKDVLVILLGAAGFILLLSGLFVGNAVAGEHGEILFTITGGFILVAGHIRNFMLCREQNCEHENISDN